MLSSSTLLLDAPPPRNGISRRRHAGARSRSFGQTNKYAQARMNGGDDSYKRVLGTTDQRGVKDRRLSRVACGVSHCRASCKRAAPAMDSDDGSPILAAERVAGQRARGPGRFILLRITFRISNTDSMRAAARSVVCRDVWVCTHVFFIRTLVAPLSSDWSSPLLLCTQQDDFQVYDPPGSDPSGFRFTEKPTVNEPVLFAV